MSKIKIALKLFVTLSSYLPKNADEYAIPEGTMVGELVEALKIPPEAVKLIFVNGKKQDADHVLEPGDRLGLFPPVGGG